MKKQTAKYLLYFLGLALQGIIGAVILTLFIWALTLLADVIAEPFNELLWGAWEAVMKLL